MSAGRSGASFGTASLLLFVRFYQGASVAYDVMVPSRAGKINSYFKLDVSHVFVVSALF